MKAADTLRGRVEQLLAARLLGTTDRDLAIWVSSLDADLRKKLERVDLLERTTPTEVTKLGAFVLAYIEGRADLKPSTRMIRHQVRELLSSYFGVDRDVTTITPGDADDWQQWLIKRGMAPSTIAKRVQVARSYFRAMVRRELISRNPFDGVRATAAANADRMYFVSREETTAILDKCPDRNWRLIIALARYGGLRTPSETLSLRWQDVDWENHRIVVTSPKTAHHEGGHCRVIPLFAELRPYLDESFQLAEEGDVYCVALSIAKQPWDLTAGECKPANAVAQNHSASRADALAQSVSEPAVYKRDGTCRDLPDPCGDQVVGQLAKDRDQALSASDRGPLCEGVGGGAESGAVGCENGAKSGAARSRKQHAKTRN